MRIDLLSRYRLPDHARERLQAFSQFVWRRFVEDSCFETAAVLAYGTVFALVPLSATAFGIVSAFPVFDEWNDRLSSYLFSHFVPEAARNVEASLRQFADSASQMTSAGIVALMLSSLVIMRSVEDTFNRIWRVTTPRPGASRFLVYWTALTLGPILVVGSVALSAWLLSLPWVNVGGISLLVEAALRLLPLLVELGAFTLAYAMVPNRPVALRHALAGGVLAVTLFELSQWGLTTYLRLVPSYQQIYGALAVLPIFLIWLYLSWAVVLLGASIAASLSAFRFQPASSLMPTDARWLATLRLAVRLLQAQTDGRSLSLTDLRTLEPAIEDDMRVALLDQLTRARLLQRNERGEWLLARDPERTPVRELYEATLGHLPLRPLRGPGLDDPIGLALSEVWEAQRRPMLAVLNRPLVTLLPPPAPPADTLESD